MCIRDRLRRERQEYQAIRDEADGNIRQRGDTPAGVGTMARGHLADGGGAAA